MDNTRVTGIAGGIGSGKSVVSRILRLQGQDVYDCDFEARRLMEAPDGEIRPNLIAKFGSGIYTDGGNLNRRYLSEVMFSDPEILKWINATVHSAVRADISKWIDRSDKERVWIESAILAGSGLTALCDDVWLVTAPEEERFRRAVKRGMSPEDAGRRISSQRDEEMLLRRSGLPVHEIDNGRDDNVLGRIYQLLIL